MSDQTNADGGRCDSPWVACLFLDIQKALWAGGMAKTPDTDDLALSLLHEQVAHPNTVVIRYPVKEYRREDGTINKEKIQADCAVFVANVQNGDPVALPSTRDDRGEYVWSFRRE